MAKMREDKIGRDEVTKMIQQSLGSKAGVPAAANTTGVKSQAKWVDRDNNPMPEDKIEQLMRTVIFKGFPKDTRESVIKDFIKNQMGEHAEELEGGPYTGKKWSERGFARFKTKGSMDEYIKKTRQQDRVKYNDNLISIGPDRGPVHRARARVLAILKSVLKDKGIVEEDIEFDVGMGVLMVTDTRIGELRGKGVQVGVDIKAANVDSMGWQFKGSDLQLAVDRKLRE